jgi:hypothetical protein
MDWPAFDLGETINQVISAIATVGGVLLGGWLAFRFGVRQLRHERAIDRRVESQEKLLAGLSDYRLSLQVLTSEYEKPATGTEEQRRLRDLMLTRTTELGRGLQTLASRAQLYCSPDGRDSLDGLTRSQILAYIASWTLATKPSPDGKELADLRKLVADLDQQERNLIVRVRTELSLPELPPRRSIAKASQPTLSTSAPVG